MGRLPVYVLLQICCLGCVVGSALSPFEVARGGLNHKKGVDVCDHPFHSWMCQGIGNKRNLNFPSNKPRDNLHLPTLISLPKSLTLPAQNPKSIFGRKSSRVRGKPCSNSELCQSVPKTSTYAEIPSFESQKTSSKKDEQISTFSLASKAYPQRTKLPKSKANYDKCSHPFHSWQCSQPTERTPLTNKPLPSSSKSLIKMNLFPQPKPTTVKPTAKPKPKSKGMTYDMCSHAFHSWLCAAKSTTRSQQKPTPKPPKLPKTTKPPVKITNHFSLPSNIPKSLVDSKPMTKEKTYNKCNHAFHSWLCQDAPKPRRPTPKTDFIKSPSNEPYKSTSAKPKKIVSKPASKPKPKPKAKYDKCSHAFHSWLCESAQRTQTRVPSPSTSKKPFLTASKPNKSPNKGKILNSQSSTVKTNNKNSVTSKPSMPPYAKKESSYSQDICSHPFHSWRCEAPKRKKRPLRPKETKASHSLFATTPKPPKITTTTATPKFTEHWKGDPCSHAFHKWLCQPLKQKNKGSSTTNVGRGYFSKSLPASTDRFDLATPSNILKGKLLKMESSSNAKVLPEQIAQSSSKKGTTSSLVIKKGKLKHQANYNNCNHPFHAWNCNHSSRKTSIDLDEIPNISSLPLEGEPN